MGSVQLCEECKEYLSMAIFNKVLQLLNSSTFWHMEHLPNSL